MSTEQVLEAIVRHIAAKAFRESAFLTPSPAALVEIYGVLDCIRDAGGIAPEQIDAWMLDEQSKKKHASVYP